MGQLLNCVTALETGEDGPASGFVSDAGDVYLEALMWANSASESLFGGSAAGPARARSSRTSSAAATRRRPRHTAEPVASTPPPVGSAGTVLADAAPRSQPGFFRRVWARCLAVFGRRVSEARG
jgi:hypothetical protein